MLTGRDIVLLASIDWEPLWQSHQEIATRFAAAGNRVLFIENTGIRPPTVAEAPRLAKRLRGWARSFLRRPRQVRPDLWVYSPVVLPPFGSAAMRAANRKLFLPAVKRAARKLGFSDPIVWTWLPTDAALDISRQLMSRRSLLIYFNIADFSSLARDREQLARTERELLSECDLVFAYEDRSRRRHETIAKRVEQLPPLVNLQQFFLAPSRKQLPERPIFGYVGGLHRFLDLELLGQCARLRPRWNWRLIGPIQSDVSSIEGLPNVELDGPRDHAELPAQVAAFDVGIVPYRLAPETESLAPTKLNEYLAAGKPAVATALPWVQEFQAHHGVLEVSTDSPDEFIAACERALLTSVDPEAAVRRRRVAEEFAWDSRLERISSLIEEIACEKEAAAARQR